MPHATRADELQRAMGWDEMEARWTGAPDEEWRQNHLTREWYCVETGEVVDHIQLMNADHFGVYDNIPKGLVWQMLRDRQQERIARQKERDKKRWCHHDNKDNITEFGDSFERYLCRDCGHMDPKPERKLPPTDVEELGAFFAECDANILRWKEQSKAMKGFLKEVDDLIEEVRRAKSK